jgi:uncharacterized ferredoxin-like protein
MVRDVNEISDAVLKQQVQGLMNRMLTAPKAKGTDDVRILYVDGEDILKLSAFMKDWGEKRERPGFIRDSSNIEKAGALVILGARRIVMGLDCGMCGSGSCKQAQVEDANCVFPVCDLGIAAGSGVSAAAEAGLDNRIMYSVGLAAVKTGMFRDPGIRVAMGIPFSASSKNVFFDRK